MLFRFTKFWIAIGLMVALWGLGKVREPQPGTGIRPVGTKPGPVRIVQFYASVGTLTMGNSALLCYGVENARTVKITPELDNVYPAHSHCVEIAPVHTTHYLMVAEGYDSKVDTRSFTLEVHPAIVPPLVQKYATAAPRVEPITAAVGTR